MDAGTAILGEEFGEVAAALTYDKDASTLRAELIDVLAVASAWVDAIDR
jgi:NTP pyrophosphatase (non-canonical NTP hydrolase)